MHQPPPEFEPLQPRSNFADLIGPIYFKRTGQGLVLGLQTAEKHCNTRGTVHGGVFSSLADIALAYNISFAGPELTPVVTASLTVDYVSLARIGDWMEIDVDIQKTGRSMAFANCYFRVGEKRIARASGVFRIVPLQFPGAE